MRPEIAQASQRLVAAAAALGEYEHAVAARARAEADVAAWNAQVEHLTRAFARERSEAEERGAGLMGFLYALVSDARLTQEQREAVEAEARLGEAIAARDQLAAHVRWLDARLAGQRHDDLVAAVTAARAAKEAAILEHADGPTAHQLGDLAVRMEAIDIELLPLEEAVRAGTAARERLVSLADVLDRARSQQLERDDARGMAGVAQAGITTFHRAVDGLGTADLTSDPFSALVTATDRTPFVDDWLRALSGSGDRLARLATARTAVLDRSERITLQLAPIRARCEELSARRNALLAQREAILRS